jgi:hypothetical protein
LGLLRQLRLQSHGSLPSSRHLGRRSASKPATRSPGATVVTPAPDRRYGSDRLMGSVRRLRRARRCIRRRRGASSRARVWAPMPQAQRDGVDGSPRGDLRAPWPSPGGWRKARHRGPLHRPRAGAHRRYVVVSVANGYGVPLSVTGRVTGLATANAARNVTRMASMSCCWNQRNGGTKAAVVPGRICTPLRRHSASGCERLALPTHSHATVISGQMRLILGEHDTWTSSCGTISSLSPISGPGRRGSRAPP